MLYIKLIGVLINHGSGLVTKIPVYFRSKFITDCPNTVSVLFQF